MPPFEVAFFEVRGESRHPRSIRVSAPEFDEARGLWRCSVELPGVLKLPAKAIGISPSGETSPRIAQECALHLARTVLSDRLLVDAQGRPFDVPSRLPSDS